MAVSTALDADNPEETKTLPPADPHAVFNTLSDLETHKHPKHGFLLSGNRVIRELLNPIECIPPFSSPTPRTIINKVWPYHLLHSRTIIESGSQSIGHH